MSNLKNSQTLNNLVKSFIGESQAHVRYQFLEYAARQEKLYEVAEAIKEIAKNEFNHARMFHSFIQSSDPNTTIQNLEVTAGYPFKEKWNFLENFDHAVQNETEETESTYPQFAKTALDEGFQNISALFNNVAKVEACHKKILTDLHNQIKTQTLYSRATPTKWKCSGCGHEETTNKAWEKCPLCQAEQGYVKLVLADN